MIEESTTDAYPCAGQWPGYHEEVYSLAVGKHPTREALAERLCKAMTMYVERESTFRVSYHVPFRPLLQAVNFISWIQDDRQPENLKLWKLGEGGITTDRIWILTIAECEFIRGYWICHIDVDPEHARS